VGQWDLRGIVRRRGPWIVDGVEGCRGCSERKEFGREVDRSGHFVGKDEDPRG